MKIKQGKRIPTKPGLAAWKIVIIAVLSALLFIAIAAVGAIYYIAKVYKPPVNTDIPDWGDVTSASPEETDDPDPLTPPKTDFTRKDQMYNFLVIGKDRVALNTDVIMIVSYNVPTGEVNILQIPRDTYIEYERNHYKINSLYANFYINAYYNGNTKTPDAEGMENFRKVIESSLNIKLDYTFLVDLEAFSQVVDAIGGVEVDVAADMDYDDPDQDLYIHIKKGYQTLKGKDAEGFIRFRMGYVTADIGRIDAQKIFISSMIQKIKNNFNVNTIGKIAEIVINNVQTDMSLVDATYFATKALSVDLGSVNLLTMPGQDGRYYGDSGAWFYIIRRADALGIVNRYFNVYNKEVTDEIFDANFAFAAEDNEHFTEIYFADPTDDWNVRSAEDVNENSIYIPRLR